MKHQKHSFHSKRESNGLQCWPQPQVLQAYFLTPVILKATSKHFGSQGCFDVKNWLDFASIFFKICRVCSLILLFLSSSVTVTVTWFFQTNHNFFLRIATNEIALFCVDNRSRQIAFFMFNKVGKGLSRKKERKAFCFFILYLTIRLWARDFYEVIVDEVEGQINYHLIEIESG